MHIKIIENYIVVDATVNGARKGRFLLDTGAGATVIVPKLADQLGLKKTRQHMGNVAGGKTISLSYSNIDSISIDGHSTKLESIVIVDINKLQGPYGEIDGVIGSDFIKCFPMTIDYPNERLIFENSDSLEVRKQNGIELNLTLKEEVSPFMNVWLNDSPMGKYKLDTGAGITHLPSTDLRSLGLNEGAPSVSAQQSSGLGGNYKVLKTHLESFSLDSGLVVKNLCVKVYDSEYGFIGGNYLRNFIVSLNYLNGYVILARP